MVCYSVFQNLVLYFRRNLGHGRVIDGLEVRWALVVRVMHALTRIGRWRDGEVEGHLCIYNIEYKITSTELYNTNIVCMRYHTILWTILGHKLENFWA